MSSMPHGERKGIFKKFDQDMAQVKRCEKTNKVIYSTKKKAIREVNRQRTRAVKIGTRTLNSVYCCPWCSYWHTSKQEKGEGKKATGSSLEVDTAETRD